MNATVECAVLERDEAINKSLVSLERALDEHDGMLAPRDAAVELLHEFRVIARSMWPMDKSTQDDLVQEMALGALECDEPHNASYYCWLGAWRARDYLRWWFLPMLNRSNLTREEKEQLKKQSEALVKADDAVKNLARMR